MAQKDKIYLPALNLFIQAIRYFAWSQQALLPIFSFFSYNETTSQNVNCKKMVTSGKCHYPRQL
jgi:hypothetical protein